MKVYGRILTLTDIFCQNFLGQTRGNKIHIDMYTNVAESAISTIRAVCGTVSVEMIHTAYGGL